MVTAKNDADTANDTVTLGFGDLPVGVSRGSQGTTRVTLTDDRQRPLVVTFAATTYTTMEGGDAVEVRVNLTPAADRNVTIPIIATGVDGEYESPTTVSFVAGERSKTIKVKALDDPSDITDGQVDLTFDTGSEEWPHKLSVGTQSTTTVMLLDDDRKALTVAFDAAEYFAEEGGDPAEVMLSLNETADREVRVPVRASGPTQAFVMEGVVVFESGKKSATLEVTALDDENQQNERVTLSLGALPQDVTAGDPATTTVVLSDDTKTKLIASFGEATYTATEQGDAVDGDGESELPGRPARNDPVGYHRGERELQSFSDVGVVCIGPAKRDVRSFRPER